MKAVIFGITGQDGSYLAELLLAKGYEVHGAIRRASTWNTGRIDGIYMDPHESDGRLTLHHADLLDAPSIEALLAKTQPDEIYNLAAQSHVAVSFGVPEFTLNTSAGGTLRLLEAIRRVCPRARLYHAGSSEMFGSSPPPQNEDTPFRPCSPYGVAKVAAHQMCSVYRDAYGLWVASGILHNHESVRRAENFVTRKTTRAIGRILAGTAKKLYLGNLDAVRDWGFAGDYVKAMWLMLQADRPRDYVVATGEAHSVKDFVERAFRFAGLDWQEHVVLEDRYLRPKEVPALRGDASRIRQELGWAPEVSFDQLVKMMVAHDIELARKEASTSSRLPGTWIPSDELDAIPLGTPEHERRRTKAWMDTAALHARNEDYWRERAQKAEGGTP